ncbi:MAG: DUF6580 family putative transport protein [Pirellulaceae bacterium]
MIRRLSLPEIVVFTSLLVSGVLLRWLLRDIPNFAPVAGIALFAGFYFSSRLVAASLPLLIMAFSDLFIGGYAPQMMALVYGMLAFPVLFRGWLHAVWDAPRHPARKPVVTLVTCGLVASCLHFLVTNLGSWLWFDMYDRTWSGLVECYVAAVPFFRFTLAGDLFFSFMLFGGYTAAWAAGMVPDTQRLAAERGAS